MIFALSTALSGVYIFMTEKTKQSIIFAAMFLITEWCSYVQLIFHSRGNSSTTAKETVTLIFEVFLGH